MLGFVIWLVVGSSVGWLLSVALRTDTQQGIMLNILAAVVGAYCGNVLLGPHIPIAAVRGVVSALAGSVLLSGTVVVVQRLKPR